MLLLPGAPPELTGWSLAVSGVRVVLGKRRMSPPGIGYSQPVAQRVAPACPLQSVARSPGGGLASGGAPVAQRSVPRTPPGNSAGHRLADLWGGAKEDTPFLMRLLDIN